MSYMGLPAPFNTVWADGRSVTAYPDGRVVDRNTGRVIREADVVEAPVYQPVPRAPSQIDPIVLVAVVGLVVLGIVVVARGR